MRQATRSPRRRSPTSPRRSAARRRRRRPSRPGVVVRSSGWRPTAPTSSPPIQFCRRSTPEHARPTPSTSTAFTITTSFAPGGVALGSTGRLYVADTRTARSTSSRRRLPRPPRLVADRGRHPRRLGPLLRRSRQPLRDRLPPWNDQRAPAAVLDGLPDADDRLIRHRLLRLRRQHRAAHRELHQRLQRKGAGLRFALPLTSASSRRRR